MSSSGTVSFPGGLTVFVQSYSNAGYIQTVTIQPASGGAAATFSGSGEGNVAMGLQTAGFLSAASSGGWPSFTTPGSASQLSSYTITCTNSQGSSSVEVNQTSFSTPAQGLLLMGAVVSEDSNDQDYNDSATLFMAYSLPAAPPAPSA
jgi:hypothetical protein